MIRQLNKLKQFNFEKFFTWSIQTFYWILWKKKFTILRIDISYFLPFTSFSLLSCRTIMHKSLSNSPIILTQNRQWRTPVKKQWIPHPSYHVPDFHSIRPTRQFQVKKKKKSGRWKDGRAKKGKARVIDHRYIGTMYLCYASSYLPHSLGPLSAVLSTCKPRDEHSRSNHTISDTARLRVSL